MSSFSIPISKDDELNGLTNPIYVQTVNTPEAITRIHDYQPSVIAGSGTANHDYAVVGSFFRLKRILISSKGNAKYEIKVGPVASLVSKAAGFTTPSQQDFEFEFEPPLQVPVTGTGTVRIVKTNQQNQSNDVFTTIMGEDVA